MDLDRLSRILLCHPLLSCVALPLLLLCFSPFCSVPQFERSTTAVFSVLLCIRIVRFLLLPRDARAASAMYACVTTGPRPVHLREG